MDNADGSIAPELLGRAFREKVFACDIQNRKLKREKLLKIEQAEKLKQEASDKGQPIPDIPVPTYDHTKPDIFYLVSGYPQTADEAEVMGKLGYAINLSLYVKPDVNEIPKIFEEMKIEILRKQQEGSSDLKEPEMPAEFPIHWKALQNALWQSYKGSPLRNLMTLIAEYKEHKEEVKEEIKEEPEEKKKRRGSKQAKLLKRQEIQPVVKEEKKVEIKIEEKKKEEVKKPEGKKVEEPAKKAEEDKKKKAEEEKKKKEEAKGPLKDMGKGVKEEEKVEVPEPVILDSKQLFVKDLGLKITELGEHFIKYNNWKDMIIVKPLFPISVNEEQFEPKIETNPQQQVAADPKFNQIQSPQLEQKLSNILQPTRDLASADDAVKTWDNRVYNSLINREDEICAGPEYILACMLQQLAYPHQTLEKFITDEAKIMDAFYKTEKKLFNEFKTPEIYEGNNIPSLSARNISFPTGDLIADVEHKFVNNLRVPGTKRFLMPQIPQKSEALRNAERYEIYPFSTLPYPELERGLLITKFEDFMTEFSGRTIDYTDREYSEKLNEIVLGQTVLKALLFEPDIVTSYYARDDSLLLALSFKVLDTKNASRSWEGQWKVRPNYHQ